MHAPGQVQISTRSDHFGLHPGGRDQRDAGAKARSPAPRSVERAVGVVADGDVAVALLGELLVGSVDAGAEAGEGGAGGGREVARAEVERGEVAEGGGVVEDGLGASVAEGAVERSRWVSRGRIGGAGDGEGEVVGELAVAEAERPEGRTGG